MPIQAFMARVSHLCMTKWQRFLLHEGSSHSVDSLDLKEEVVEELFKFTRHIIYGDKKSNTMAEARTTKWKKMKNKSFVCLPPDADSLRQHCLRANYLAYLVRHPSLKCHPSSLGLGWELVGSRYRPVRHIRSALPMVSSCTRTSCRE